MQDPTAYGDKVMETAMAEANGWLNASEAREAVNSALKALKKVADRLADADFLEMKPEIAAKTAMNLAKMADELARLVEFSQGKADSRPDTGRAISDLMRVLTNEQFEQFGVWIEEAKAAGRLV